MPVVLAAVALVLLTGPNGQKIYVNTNEISTIREPRGMEHGHFAKGTQCVVIMTNGNIAAVREACDMVRARMEAAK